MGEVYRDIGEEPVRLEMRENDQLVGICQAIIVPARRGKHLAVPYGPVVSTVNNSQLTINLLVDELKKVAKDNGCTFIRLSPFWPKDNSITIPNTKHSPLHLLAEHIWYLPLITSNTIEGEHSSPLLEGEGSGVRSNKTRTEEDILKSMRQNHRNLIRRAEREDIEVIASTDPNKDIEEFFWLYDETRKRHHFVPYPNNFIRSQVKRFAERNECTLYLAKYQNEVLAASVHMHLGGETSYHHGASTHKYPKLPASYALQWRAIKDALSRGDHMFNFWGISPEGARNPTSPFRLRRARHPFAGVRTFKTGFGGELLELVHCMDIPVSNKYYLTRAFETYRKWKRGF
jgi:lipid II:glycine glycyltransferase (peptidoglycan interpeptide bridge formation enzyme)